LYPKLHSDPRIKHRVHGASLPKYGQGRKPHLASRFLWEFIHAPKRSFRALSTYRNEATLSLLDVVTVLHIIRLQADVLHYQFGSLAVPHALLSTLVGSAVVVSFRGSDIAFHGLDDLTFYSRVWQWAHAFHFRSVQLQDRAFERGCPTTVPQAVIPPRIDRSFLHDTPPSSNAQPLRVLSVGRLHWKKGYEFALKAIALASEQGANLAYTIIGEGPRRGILEQMVNDLNLHSMVSLLGHRPHNEVRSQLLQHDLLLHPAISEGFPNVVLEAQATSRPVLAADAEGVRDAVLDGRTGYITSRRDSAAIGDLLVTLATQRRRLATLGSSGFRHVSTTFVDRDEPTEFLALYRAALHAARLPTRTISTPITHRTMR
jgi:colanic acid/amylovoran biosynthesis glycosyltransferase